MVNDDNDTDSLKAELDGYIESVEREIEDRENDNSDGLERSEGKLTGLEIARNAVSRWAVEMESEQGGDS